MLLVNGPQVDNKIMLRLTPEQVVPVIEKTICVRDKAIGSLFADSVLRLCDIPDNNQNDVDWANG